MNQSPLAHNHQPSAISHRPLAASYLRLIIPLLLWLFLFRDFLFFQTNTINLDTILSYAMVKFFMNNLLNGVFPLWDPFSDGGIPFYSLIILGFFNPLIYVIAVLVKLGMSYYSAYLVYLVTSFFLGALGFYFLAKEIVGDRRIAYWAYLILLFSGMGTSIFTQLNMLLIFVPSVWAFCFLMRFVKRLQRGDLLGLTFSLMVAVTSYIPFHFLTVVVVVIFFWICFFFKECILWLKAWGAFVRKNIVVNLVCLLALGVSVVPLMLYKISDANNEVVTPARHCAEKSVEACYNDTMSNRLGLSLEETTKYGTLGERLSFRGLFVHLDKVSYGMEVFFYIPVFGYILFLLSIFCRTGKKDLVLFFSIIVIFLIALGGATGVYPFLFKHIFYFQYFRNLFFFSVFLIPMLILLMGLQYRKFLDYSSQEKAERRTLLFWVSVVHFVFFVVLLQLKEVLFSSLLTIVLSWVFWGWILGRGEGKRFLMSRWATTIVSVLILFEPLQVFYFYNQNAKVFSCDLPQNHVTPSFSLVRPEVEIEIPCSAKNFLTYIPEFWPNMLMSDGPGLIGYPATVGRGVFFLSKHMNPASWGSYVRNKFIVYDEVRPFDENERNIPLLVESIENHMNVVFVANADADFLKAFDSRQKDPSSLPAHPLAIVQPTDVLKVEHFDVNSLEISTHFDQNKFLVYTDSFNSHWKVFINGTESKLYKANSAFKGVWLPHGKNKVLFQYLPPGGVKVYIFIILFFGLFLGYTVYALYDDSKRGGVEEKGIQKQKNYRPQGSIIEKKGPVQLIFGLFNRSIVLYLLTGIIIGRLVNWQIPKKQYERYVLGVFANGGFKNFNDGILYFDTIIASDPKSADGFAGLGACYFNLGLYDKAIEFFEKTVRLTPDSKKNRRLLENAYKKKTANAPPPSPTEQIKLEFNLS